MPVTLHFQSTGTIPSNARPVAMVGCSLTVGRSLDNDLVLPDPGKVISKHHCAIEDQNGEVVIIDLSANGTFLNYGKAPLGRMPTPLNDGDILTMGAYELLVEIRDDRPQAEPPLGTAVPRGAAGSRAGALGDLDEHGDFLDDLLGDAPLIGPASVRRPEPGEDGLLPPLDEDLLGSARDEPISQSASLYEHGASARDSFRPSAVSGVIPEDWGDGLVATPSATSPPVGVDPFAKPEETTPLRRHAVAAPLGSAPAPAAGDAAARAFLKALGSVDVPEGELEETMARLGHVLKTVIHGMREILMTRAAIKSEFRIQQTIIRRSGNNPLKFSVSPEQAVEALVRPRAAGYLDPVRAAEEALSDIKAHEIAMMSGMEAALKGILEQLAPEALEKQIQTRSGVSDMLKSRKALYWEAYERLYHGISDQAEKEFHELFSREFARAYQAQLSRLR